MSRRWCEVKSRRGAPKRVDTAGYACPNRKCFSSGITDAHIHAVFLGMASMARLRGSRRFEVLPAAPRSVRGAIPPSLV